MIAPTVPRILQGCTVRVDEIILGHQAEHKNRIFCTVRVRVGAEQPSRRQTGLVRACACAYARIGVCSENSCGRADDDQVCRQRTRLMRARARKGVNLERLYGSLVG